MLRLLGLGVVAVLLVGVGGCSAESDGEARTRGRAEAQSIVAATLGEGVRPPPVGPRGEVHQGE